MVGGGTSICDLLSRAIPTIIPTKISKISVTVHLMDIWVIMSAVLKTGVLRRMEKHDLQSHRTSRVPFGGRTGGRRVKILLTANILL